MENETLASELLREVKTSARRTTKVLSLALLISNILWFSIVLALVGTFMWYISLPVEEVSTVEMQNDDGNLNYLEESSINGDINNGEN